MEEVELDNGGVMHFDTEDGIIRHRDQHGNCENIWRPSDPDYKSVKETYFPSSSVVDTETDRY